MFRAGIARGHRDAARNVFMRALPAALFVLTASAASAGVAPDACLTGTDPAVATDAAQIRALRDAIDQACVCSSFDGSKGHGKSDYKACTEVLLQAALMNGELRAVCEKTVAKMLKASICGVSPALTPVPCVQQKGDKAVCKIAKLTKKDGLTPTGKCESADSRNSCRASSFCVDAGDTDGDLVVGAGDSGGCPGGNFLLSNGSGKYVHVDPETKALVADSDDAASILERFDLNTEDSGVVHWSARVNGQPFSQHDDGFLYADGAGAVVDFVVFVQTSDTPPTYVAIILRDGPGGSDVDVMLPSGDGRLTIVTMNVLDALSNAANFWTFGGAD